MDFEISDYEIPLNEYRFDNVGDLVLDLKAEMLEIDNASPVWKDISGTGNHLTEFEGESPEIMNSHINGEKAIRLSGNSMISSINNLVEDNESYSIFTVARYFGKKQGRIISSMNGNWTFGFHNGNRNSWLSGKEWLNKCDDDANFEWALNSGTYDSKEKVFNFWNGNDQVIRGTSNKYHIGICRLSIGAWKSLEQEPSECEIARILVFKGALSEDLGRHVRNILSMIYGLGVTKEDYVNWAQWLGVSLSRYPEIYSTASRLYLTELEDFEKDRQIMKYSNYSDKNSHELMVLRNLLAENIDEAVKYSYVQFFLNPRDTRSIKQLIEMKIFANESIEAIDLFELINSRNKQKKPMSAKQINQFLFDNSILQYMSQEDIFGELIEMYFSKEIRSLSDLSDLNGKIENFLINDGSYYSNLISERIGLGSRDSEIREKIIDELNKNKNADSVIRYSTEYFKHNKRRYVGGFADRLKGAATVMLISIATGRRFEIDWKYPFELEEIILPNDYDWRTKYDAEVEKKVVLIDNKFSDEEKEILRVGDIIKKWEAEDLPVSINCNIFYADILDNPNTEGRFYDLQHQWDFPNILGTLLSTFEYKPNLVEANIINNFVQYLNLFEDSIALHFRTGGDGDWDDPAVDKPENIIHLIDKAREIMKESGKRTCVYFATDSTSLKNKILSEYGEEFNMVSIEIPLAHVDRTLGDEQISGTRFAIMENHLISMCDHILTGKGSFSVISSCRKFKWPWRYFKTHT